MVTYLMMYSTTDIDMNSLPNSLMRSETQKTSFRGDEKVSDAFGAIVGDFWLEVWGSIA